ncbi:LPS-assembly protein LptD [Rhabdochromatium marinum]|uniref:LPS-assembly protein LptD n=1 Tax=Rhabdochromatium marinum TaxID=48729 RepID=UPI001907C24F|nr:LPS assembly protein LptD [Rhabdochromatium marinum]MBK1648353.1 organic solvent tolerance protein [Rhabdochromatium marinum]
MTRTRLLHTPFANTRLGLRILAWSAPRLGLVATAVLLALESIAGVAADPVQSSSAARAERINQGLDWNYCGPRPPQLGPWQEAPAPGPRTPIDVEAGGVIFHQDRDVIELIGGVQLVRGTQEIDTDRLHLERQTGQVTAIGETYLAYPGLRVIGDEAQINLDTDQGRIAHAAYRFSGQANLRGQAEQVEIRSPQQMQLTEVRYSACPPGRDAWSLHARTLDLDQASGRGTARHAQLRIKGVPVLYSPYLSFPIDDRRKSGFLMPSIGNSDENGLDITQPYYLNLAPNLDATLYPRIMSKRGFMLGGELRYLTRQDQGIISGEVIPNDSAYDQGNRTRGALHIEQNGRFWDRWGTHIDYSLVSDDDYLEDLGTRLEVTSTRRLVQRGDLSYFGDGWTLLGRMEAFQTIDPEVEPEARPYGRLPQLLLSTRQFRFGPGLEAELQAEYDYFDHNHLVDGQRLTLSPRISWPWRRSFGHLTPSLGVHFSRYQLNNQEPELPEDPSHLIPSFDLDGGLVFERPTQWFGTQTLQTLEPRLFYLYTPYEDQSETPVFDSSELSFSFTNLFRTNRFTGRDRIGDANQLTLGLTSRTLATASGAELFRASLGHIVYFADRRVQIDGSAETTPSSPFAAELAARLFKNWHGRASVQWDADTEPGDSNWQKRTLQLDYRPAQDHRLLNLAYRFDQGTNDENSYEDTDLSFRWPLIQGRAELVGRWLYSMQHERTMEAVAGVEFGQCCWRLRLVGRHFKNSPDTSGSNSVMVQLELAGLGSIGSSIDSFLAREINGYQVN